MNEIGPALETPGRAFSHEEIGAEAARFSRHRYELPLLAVFLCLALLELLTVHLLVSMWSSTAAWILTVLTAAAVLQVVLLIRGMVRHPTEIDERSIHVRYGASGHVVVPLATVERVENIAFAPEVKGRGVFRASLIASPNVAVHLKQPVIVRKRRVSTITLRLDDPSGFLAELAART